jgi:hypothetical protein
VRRILLPAALAALALVGGTTTIPATASPRILPATSTRAPDAACAEPVLDRARRALDVKKNDSPAFRQAAARNDETVAGFAAMADDKAMWLDQCGATFYVEPAQPLPAPETEPQEAPITTQATPTDVFALQSKPGAARTIYLDFTGVTITNTVWNTTYNQPTITAEPYSNSAPADTNFTDAERAEIYEAWQVVAEDYAPFDINVTTADLGPAAIDRASPSDTQYGSRVIVTGSGPISASCYCGGVAYVDTFSLTSQHAYYQPAWAFTSGVGVNGLNIGQVASHEAGHNLGLAHDGTPTASYYSGSGAWAPIMGASYNRRVSQWSAGEYPGANNTEDDLSLISEHAPVRTDDHPSTALNAVTVTEGSPVAGTITTRTDTDAFKFVGSGLTSVSATTQTADLANLDIQLRIVDATGTTIAQVNPPVSLLGLGILDNPSGLNATWTGDLPSTPATYTAIVDGVGSGTPSNAGDYSDYGSLGNYMVSVDNDPTTPQPPPTPTPPASEPPVSEPPASPPATPETVTVKEQHLTGLRPGQAFTAQLAVSGNLSPATWSALTSPPPGLTLSPDGTLSGTPVKVGVFDFLARARSGTSSDSATITVTVTNGPLTFTTRRLRAARVGRSYKETINVIGGIGRYTWSRPQVLPAGLKIRVSADRKKMTFSGRPTKPGKYTLRLRVKDASGEVLVRKFVLAVKTR